jgi:hypothetical protein
MIHGMAAIPANYRYEVKASPDSISQHLQQLLPVPRWALDPIHYPLVLTIGNGNGSKAFPYFLKLLRVPRLECVR